ncbi:MAG: Dam family site-specific DNA-(adenine-N6)-methyltransferase [Endozoicomonadaceae bacterium]|nr:Dam family site-specific DNA-(adenine-N6)-methyltransferase [Endozoicomonadaceae bacterium]
MDKVTSIVPVVKWAGGKRWLVTRHQELFPTNCERLVEPFLGGASIFLKLLPKKAFLSDLNPELITTYKAIRDDWQSVQNGLINHHNKHNKDHYYQVRSETPTDSISTAIRFLYLNRTCWNGLYRVNKKGIFNVPIGTKTKVLLPTDDFESLAKVLKKANLVAQDYRITLKQVRRNDFVYIDPPYTVNHNKNGFLKYNESIFAWTDQVQLREEIENAAMKGAKIIVSQANHESIRDLYKDIGTSQVLNRASVLAPRKEFRKSVEELLIFVN